MAANIAIVDAAESDLPGMIALQCDANETEILTGFLFGKRPADARQKQTESLMVSLGRRFTSPTNRCHILKAINEETSELLGWILVRWEDGTWNSVSLPGPDADRDNFPVFYQRQVRRNWIKLTGDQPVVVIGALYVKVDKQNQGVGRRLVEHIYSTYGLHKDLVCVQTRGLSEGFYHKLGWSTVSSSDFDLSEWGGGPGRGYGIHRNPQMLRYPS